MPVHPAHLPEECRQAGRRHGAPDRRPSAAPGECGGQTHGPGLETSGAGPDPRTRRHGRRQEHREEPVNPCPRPSSSPSRVRPDARARRRCPGRTQAEHEPQASRARRENRGRRQPPRSERPDRCAPFTGAGTTAFLSPPFSPSCLLQRRIHPPLLRSASSGSSTYRQVRLRYPPGARLALAASPTLRDENP